MMVSACPASQPAGDVLAPITYREPPPAEQAARCRRLAAGMLQPADRDRLLAMAAEYDLAAKGSRP